MGIIFTIILLVLFTLASLGCVVISLMEMYEQPCELNKVTLSNVLFLMESMAALVLAISMWVIKIF